MAASAEPSFLTSGVLVHAGWIHLEAGHWAEASSYLEDGVAAAERLRLTGQLTWAHAGLCLLEALHGKATNAQVRAEQLLKRVGADAEGADWLLCMLARAHHELGNHRLAEALAAQAAERAGVGDLNWEVRIQIWLVQAMAAARQGQEDAASRRFDEALAKARDLHLLWEEAMVLEGYAEAHTLVGEVAAASALLQESLTIFQRLGAIGHAERVERSLGRVEGVIFFPGRKSAR
jgi:tetratricopeptide (TPR) repeat protein